jgi:hypothetical protein
MVSRADSKAGTDRSAVRETARAAAPSGLASKRRKGRQALTADLRVFIGGTCLRLAFLFFCRSSCLLPGRRHQALTAIVGNLEMTLLENNFYFNRF